MTIAVEQIDRRMVMDLISQVDDVSLSDQDKKTFRQCLIQTTTVWTGLANGKLVCIWGLIPPTLLSDTAYLWLYTTEAIRGHEFLFVRHSQIAVKGMLELYPIITGITKVGNDQTIRWLRWLGAKFLAPVNGILPFTIRKS